MYRQDVGWLAEESEDYPGMFVLSFQGPSMICTFADLWFYSEEDALWFAETYVIGYGLFPQPERDPGARPCDPAA